MIYYLLPPNGAPPSIAPSLARKERGVGTNEGYTDGVVGDDKGRPYPYPTNAEPGNPTVIPQAILEGFHFTFLIRHPRYSVPSYYRCTVPPLDKVTGFFEYMPSEAGYDELRRFFDYLRSIDQVGPRIATGGNAEKRTDGKEITNGITNGVTNGDHGIAAGVEICVVDADDLLDNPTGIVEAFCHSVGIHYDQEMLTWDTEKDHQQAKDAFEKWTGFHEDAIDSKDLKPRLHVSHTMRYPRKRRPRMSLLTYFRKRRSSRRVKRLKMQSGVKSLGIRGPRSFAPQSTRTLRITSTSSNSL